jgi:hypothetical protein
MEAHKKFKMIILLPNGTDEIRYVWARTKWEAVQLAMYRDGYWNKQPDMSKYKVVTGKKTKTNISIHTQVN